MRPLSAWQSVSVCPHWLLLLLRVRLVGLLLLLRGLHLLLGWWVAVAIINWTLVTACCEFLWVAAVEGVDAVGSDLALEAAWIRVVRITWDGGGLEGSLGAGLPSDLLWLLLRW